jgi:hypothetical protein
MWLRHRRRLRACGLHVFNACFLRHTSVVDLDAVSSQDLFAVGEKVIGEVRHCGGGYKPMIGPLSGERKE